MATLNEVRNEIKKLVNAGAFEHLSLNTNVGMEPYIEVRVYPDRVYGKSTRGNPEFTPTKVIFNGPATIVYWADDTKTIVKCGHDDTYDWEKGLAMCFAKKALGNKGSYFNVFKKHSPMTEVSNHGDNE